MENNTYTYQEALEKSIEYFNGDDLAGKVFCDKYALRNNQDEILEDTPEKMHRRLARELARIESTKFKNPLSEDQIFNYFDRFKKLILQGSSLFGMGNPFQLSTLSNCYVLETPLDSYGGICKTDEQLVQISKRRGGCGIDISHIRPAGSIVKNSSRTSTGIGPFMQRFSNSIREVGQGGRRGALMMTISVHHPEVLVFSTIKKDKNKVTGANISIRLSNEFLEAVDKNIEYEQRWPVDSKNPVISKKVNAREIWKQIIECAHEMAEPGLLFWDTIIEESPADCYSQLGFRTISTNPCVVGDTKILIRGAKHSKNSRIDKLVGKTVEVWNGQEWSKTEVKITGKNQPILEIKTSSGKKLKCTYNHSFILEDEKRVSAINLKIGDRLLSTKEIKSGEIISIKNAGIADIVYCFTEPKLHRGVFNGILTGQCSELPLSVLDSCRLGVINVFSYVDNPFTDQAKFNYNLFFEDSKILQRLMDDVVDLELEHIDKILNKIKDDPEPEDSKSRELELWNKIKLACLNGRRTGSGITGLGDALAALNIKYGSEESIRKTGRIYKTLKLACYQSSVEMAKELGAFPVWDHNLEKNNPFLLRIKDEDEELWKEMKKYGRRNIALLTTAPTGSVSILTQTSSGVEPVFQLSYIRRKKITHEDKNCKIDFVDNTGDQWQNFDVYHNTLKQWMEVTGNSDIKKSPWYDCCAEDLNWPDRVKLQATAQKHIDHAISSTLNLPENVTVDKVAEIYETAWRSGCKGITVYRKNCRTGVLIDKKPEQSKIIRSVAPKRPKIVKSELHHFILNKHRYYVAVGFLEGEIYEVFTGENHNDDGDIIIPKDIKLGKIRKDGRGKYIFISDKDTEYKLTNGHNDDTADALTRIVSLSLRHGSGLDFIVHQLEKTRGPLTSFSKVLARTLKKYLKDGTKIHGESCLSCGGNNLERNSGCVTCKDCGSSKC